MSASDGELLQRFLDGHREEAARALVDRHLALVHSTCTRRLEGDHAAAADVSQQVFLDLLHKAEELRPRESIGGWLHLAACHRAGSHRRADIRRKARETTHSQMTEDSTSEITTLEWSLVRPVLDEALLELAESDRDALIHRYFGEKSHSQIAQLLEVSENAARMRVDRALERLGQALNRRGIQSTLAAIAHALERGMAAEIPASVRDQVQRAIQAQYPGGPNPVARSAAVRRLPGILRLSVPAILVVCFTLALVRSRVRDSSISPTPSPQLDPNEPPVAPAPAPAAASVTAITRRNPGPSFEASGLQLQVISALSNEPVPGAHGTAIWWDRAHQERVQTAQISKSGSLSLDRPRASAMHAESGSFRVEVQASGFGTRVVQWFPYRGSPIPANYTVRLTPAAAIGGQAIDLNGRPVVRAHVQLHHSSALVDETAREFPGRSTSTSTDDDGRWFVQTIETALLPDTSISIRHPDFGPAIIEGATGNIERLLARDHLTRLTPSGLVRGDVVDETGRGVADAVVQFGDGVGNSEQQTKSSADGTFELRGLPLIESMVSASAFGFATTGQSVTVGTGGAAPRIRLVLLEGRPLRVRLVNYAAEPLAGIKVYATPYLDPGRNIRAPGQRVAVTSQDGWCDFTHLPPGAIGLQAAAPGYMERSSEIAPAGAAEHTIRMPPALHLHGTVRAAGGKDGGAVRIIPGQILPQPGYNETNFSNDSYRHYRFESGTYAVDLKRTPISNLETPLHFKFLADGFRPFVSRAIQLGESDVTLDVVLEPTASHTFWLRNPDGSPALNARLAAYQPGTTIAALAAGSLTTWVAGTEDRLWPVDGEGKVTVDDAFLNGHLVAANYLGVVTITAVEAMAARQIQLQPWGRIEGYLRDVPADPTQERVIEFYIGDNYRPEGGPFKGVFASTTGGFRAIVEPDGHFVFPRVPPGRQHQLHEMMAVGVNQIGTPHPKWHRQRVDVDVRSGETTRLDMNSR